MQRTWFEPDHNSWRDKEHRPSQLSPETSRPSIADVSDDVEGKALRLNLISARAQAAFRCRHADESPQHQGFNIHFVNLLHRADAQHDPELRDHVGWRPQLITDVANNVPENEMFSLADRYTTWADQGEDSGRFMVVGVARREDTEALHSPTSLRKPSALCILMVIQCVSSMGQIRNYNGRATCTVQD